MRKVFSALAMTAAIGAGQCFAAGDEVKIEVEIDAKNDAKNDGKDCEHAVVIAGTNNPNQGIAEEKAWINEHFPGFKFQKQSLSGDEAGHRFDIIEFKDAADETRSVCFDITAFFGFGKYADKVRKKLSVAELAPYQAALAGGDKAKRQDAVYRLAYVLPEAKEAAHKLLIAATRDADNDIRFAAIDSVAAYRKSDAVAPLTELLANSDPDVAAMAAQQLGKLGADALPTQAGLVKLLSSTRNRTRLSAAKALYLIGVHREESMTVMLALMRDDDNKWVRQEAAFALAQFDDSDPRVVPALIKAMSDPDVVVAQYACSTLAGYKSATAQKISAERKEECAAFSKRAMDDLLKNINKANAKPG